MKHVRIVWWVAGLRTTAHSVQVQPRGHKYGRFSTRLHHQTTMCCSSLSLGRRSETLWKFNNLSLNFFRILLITWIWQYMIIASSLEETLLRLRFTPDDKVKEAAHTWLRENSKSCSPETEKLMERIMLPWSYVKTWYIHLFAIIVKLTNWIN